MRFSLGWTWPLFSPPPINHLCSQLVEVKTNMSWFLFNPFPRRRQDSGMKQTLFTISSQWNGPSIFPPQWIFCFTHEYVILCCRFMFSVVSWCLITFLCVNVWWCIIYYVICMHADTHKSTVQWCLHNKCQSRSQYHQEICISFGCHVYFTNKDEELGHCRLYFLLNTKVES